MKSNAWLGKLSITILDSPWTVYFKTDKQYQRLKIKGSRAVTLIQGTHKSIHFNVEATFPGDRVVDHELVHAYVHELMGHDLNFSDNEREEFYCTLFETRGNQLRKKAAPITAQLMKHYRKTKAKSVNKGEDEDE